MDRYSYHCPLCDFHGHLLTFRGRPHAQCPRCFSLERHRFQFLVLKQVLDERTMQGMSALHFAPEPRIGAYFAAHFGCYKTADLMMKDVDYQVDIQLLPFDDECFDFVFASHVLEHIPDDRKALSEIQRILKPNGIAILPVPIVCEHTVEYDEPDPLQDYHVRAPGLDYYNRYNDYFSTCNLYSSNEVSQSCQPFIYIGQDYKHPLRQDNEKMSDIMPVCYR